MLKVTANVERISVKCLKENVIYCSKLHHILYGKFWGLTIKWGFILGTGKVFAGTDLLL